MNKKVWKLAGILGGAFLMVAGSGMEVRAEEAEIVEENYILEAQDWSNRAVANVKTYANIREAANVDSKVVGILQKGAYVEVVGTEGEWTRIESGEVKGYIKTDLLVFGEDAKDFYYENHGVNVIVTGDAVNVYDLPCKGTNVVATKKKGVQIEALARREGWYRVQLTEKTSSYYTYMHEDDIDLVEVKAISWEDYQAQKAAEAEAKRKAEEAKRAEAAKNNSSVSASKSEIAMLAAIIECEAGGESYKGKVAVGAVVLNRVKSSKFPNTISAVIKQRGQFTPVASGKFARVLSRGANDSCYQAAIDALNGSNPVGNALFFNTGSGRGFRLGNHQFY